jgi:hypothetical protein
VTFANPRPRFGAAGIEVPERHVSEVFGKGHVAQDRLDKPWNSRRIDGLTASSSMGNVHGISIPLRLKKMKFRNRAPSLLQAG